MTDRQLAQIVWDYMRYEQPIEKADIIFGLGSDDIRIAEYAVDLYHRGFADKILFTGGLIEKGPYQHYDEPEAIVFQKYALSQNVPAEVIIIEPTATNTGENITRSYELLKQQDFLPKKLILVQKPFMLRRTYATFMKQWPDANKPQIITSAVDVSMEDYVKDQHYDFVRTVNIMVGDLQRIREYPKLGFQIEQEIPDEVWSAYEELLTRGYNKHLLM